MSIFKYIKVNAMKETWNQEESKPIEIFSQG